MHTLLKLATALAAAGILGNAQAVVVSPGTGPIAGPAVGPPYSSVSDFGTLLEFVSTDLSTPTFAGEARAAVFDGREPGVNLDFYYQFTNFGSSKDAIARITAGGFAGMSVDVRQDGGMWGSFVRGMSAAGTVDMGSDGTLGFNFTPNAVSPGMTTTVLRVRTAATSYVDNFMGIIDGTATFAPAFAPGGVQLPPVAEIPEPGTYALMLAGLGMLGVIGRRRRQDTTV